MVVTVLNIPGSESSRGCGQNPGPEIEDNQGGFVAMKHYTPEEKMAAVKLYIQYDYSPSAVIYQLGYPSRGRLRSWYEEYCQTGTFVMRYGNNKKYC